MVEPEEVGWVVAPFDLHEAFEVRPVRVRDPVALVVGEVVDVGTRRRELLEGGIGLPDPAHVGRRLRGVEPLADEHEVVARRTVRIHGSRRIDPAHLAVEVLDHHRAHDRRRRLERRDHRLHGGVAELGEERRLPVVERPPRERVVEQRVHDRVRHRLDEVHRRRPERPQRRQVCLRLGQIAGMAERKAAQLHPAAVRGVHESAEDGDLVGQLLGELAIHFEHVRRSRQGCASSPPRMMSSGWVSNSKDAATPKFPPPPRSAQNRSGSSSALTTRT